MTEPLEPPLIVLTGATGSGKGAVAHELALRAGGEILSLDSMKIYREMDIGTAKPSPKRRRSVRYHLLDIASPDEEYSTGDYLPLLEGAIEDVRSRGRLPIVCGGTALYLVGFLRGLGSLPPAHWEVRERLISEARDEGVGALHARLAEVDPVAAKTFASEDLRRIVRALEVHELTGRRMSDQWDWSVAAPRGDVVLFGIEWERGALYARTDRRVTDMVEAGLFEEARRLRDRRPPAGRTARQCIGYKEIIEGWETGADRTEIVERIQRNTRRLVKRQLTWFRKLDIRWIFAGDPFDPARIAARIHAGCQR